VSFTARRRDRPSEVKVFVQNARGQVINPATEERLTTLLTWLRGYFRANIFNTPLAANTNFFAQDIGGGRYEIFKIYIAMSAPGILSVVRTRGGTSVVEQLNGGDPLKPNVAYRFDVFNVPGESINLRYSVDATILKCQIVSVYMFTA